MEDPAPHPTGWFSAEIFAPIQAHGLASISCTAIRRFFAESAHYESSVASKPGLSPIFWAFFIAPIFFQSLLVICLFEEGFKGVFDLADYVTKAKLAELLGSKPVSFCKSSGRRETQLPPPPSLNQAPVPDLQELYKDLLRCEEGLSRGASGKEGRQKILVPHLRGKPAGTERTYLAPLGQARSYHSLHVSSRLWC